VHNKIPVSECIISETGIYTNCGRGSFLVHNIVDKQLMQLATQKFLIMANGVFERLLAVILSGIL
ncbi:hypothetical protein Q7Y93_09925, partial [Glaesserella parasuis]|nr:hypothetical protein [Glaesserella parasuis]MDP0470177.1 hypothetical protein [Glaesserella parasuis]